MPHEQLHGQVTGYPESAAREYLAGGWQPLPLLSAGKGLTLPGRTGYSRCVVTEADVQRWAAQDHQGLCLRLVDALGLDIDAHDQSKPAVATLAGLVRELGPLPPTVRVSARYGHDYDNHSGILLYRLPDQYDQLQLEPVWRSGWPGLDLIRFGHRQVVVWPSRHPKRGTLYGWADERAPLDPPRYCPLPPLPTLPALPPAWVEACLKPERPAGPPITINATVTPSGDMCPATRRTLDNILSKPRRHDDWLLLGLTSLARLAEQGHQTGDAWTALHDAFVQAVTVGDGSRTPAEAESEWQRALRGITLNGSTPATERGCCRVRSTLADIRAQIRRHPR